MLETATQERQASAGAFEGNLLLSTFSPDYRALLETSAEIVQLDVGEHIQTRGSDVEWSYFPYGTTMISLVVRLKDGRSTEVASIGREGAVGGIVSCGHAPSRCRPWTPPASRLRRTSSPTWPATGATSPLPASPLKK